MPVRFELVHTTLEGNTVFERFDELHNAARIFVDCTHLGNAGFERVAEVLRAGKAMTVGMLGKAYTIRPKAF